MAEKSGANSKKRIGIAVGIGSSPNSVRLVEWAHKAAAAMHVDWIAFHIDGGAILGREDRDRLEENLTLARNLGAQVATVIGADVVRTLIAAAAVRGATMLVVGRSGLSRIGRFQGKATISDRLLREADTLDVVVVGDSTPHRRNFALASAVKAFSAPFSQYGLLVAVLVLVTAICMALESTLGNRSVALLYLAAILLFSLVSNPAPVALLAVGSSLAYNFFFITPRFTFAIASPEDIILFGLYFLVAAVTGFLSSGLRSRERLLLKRDKVATLLLAAAERFAELKSVSAAGATAAELVERYYGGPAVVYVTPDGNQLESYCLRGVASLSHADEEAAKACAATGEICGAGTPRLASAEFRYISARAGERPIAAIGFSIKTKKGRTSGDDELFSALGRSLALFMERERSEEYSRKAILELESERLAKVLFDSVSHELRTPLTTITGSLSALKDDEIASDVIARSELLEGALCSAGRLNKVVEDFLSISRMESGRLKLCLEPIEPSFIGATASAATAEALAGRHFSISLPAKPREYRLDAALVGRLAVNLLENACKYSRNNGDVELRLQECGEGLSLAVRDAGPGFSDERMRLPFSKFRRTEGDQPGGLGLGLAICRGIAEAHGGRISARKVEDGFEVEAIFPDCRGGETE